MPVGEFQKLLAIDLIGQNPQRLVSLLRETQATRVSTNHCLLYATGTTIPVSRIDALVYGLCKWLCSANAMLTTAVHAVSAEAMRVPLCTRL